MAKKRREHTGVVKTLWRMFNENHTHKLTDVEIKAELIRQFGDKAYFHNLSNLRTMFNAGRLGPRPTRKSKRYGMDGKLMAPNERYKKC